jgi:hypothetical protein
VIKKLGQHIRLMRGRSVVGKRAAQIAEARGRDDPEPPSPQTASEQQPLVEAAPGSVDHHEGRAIACNSELQRTRARLNHLSLPGQPAFRLHPRFAEGAGGVARPCQRQTANSKKDPASCQHCVASGQSPGQGVGPGLSPGPVALVAHGRFHHADQKAIDK